MAYGTQGSAEGMSNDCYGARGGMGQSPFDRGGPGGSEGEQAYVYPRTGCMPMGMPGGSNDQGRNEGGTAYGMQGGTQDGANCSTSYQGHGSSAPGYYTPGQSQTGGQGGYNGVE